MCYEKFNTGKALNRHLLSCNFTTKDVYLTEKSKLSFDEKNAAKYASPLSIMGFAGFETKLDGKKCNDDFKDALES